MLFRSGNARTIAVSGDLRQMSTEFLRGAHFEKYGNSMYIGIGIPITVLDEDMARRVSIRNEQIDTNVIDYGDGNKVIGRANYADLRNGEITIDGHKIRTAPLPGILSKFTLQPTQPALLAAGANGLRFIIDRKRTRLNSSHI